MAGWKSLLKDDPTKWLLGEDNPSVRYLTLTEILDKQPDDPEVVKVKAEIMTKGVVPKILSKQDNSGRWNLENSFNGRFQVNIEKKSEPSKWITLRALTVLKRYYA